MLPDCSLRVDWNWLRMWFDCHEIWQRYNNLLNAMAWILDRAGMSMSNKHYGFLSKNLFKLVLLKTVVLLSAA